MCARIRVWGISVRDRRRKESGGRKEEVRTEEVERALALVVGVVVVDERDALFVERADVPAVEGDLPRERDGPDDDGEDGDDEEPKVATRAPVHELEIEHEVPDHERTDDGACALEGGVERTRGAVEDGGVDRALVGVEVV